MAHSTMLHVKENNNLFWQVEYVNNIYSDISAGSSTTKLTSSVLALGVGYRF